MTVWTWLDLALLLGGEDCAASKLFDELYSSDHSRLMLVRKGTVVLQQD